MKESSGTYQVGDRVLLNARSMGLKVSKLAPTFLGPYVVTGVHKADITMSHVVTGDTKVVHMEHLKPFFAACPEDGYRAALVDYDQYVLQGVLAWKGDPEKRSGMEFLVLFEDGECVWLPYSKDLSGSAQFQAYCEANAPLKPLMFSLDGWVKWCASENRKSIGLVHPGLVCYVDLRAWGSDWYASCKLPEAFLTVYVVSCEYTAWENPGKSRIGLYCRLFKQRFVWKNSDIVRYGLITSLSGDMVLVDEGFAEKFPSVLRG